MSMAEEWRPIPDWDGYQVSSRGRVRSRRASTRPRLMKLKVGKVGYVDITLVKDRRARTLRVHRLVAEAFLGPCPTGHEVRHLDGVRTNNAVANLEYSTHSVNMRDRREHGTDRNAAKTHCPRGHEYTAENTIYRDDNRRRQCRQCTYASNRAWRAANPGRTETRRARNNR